MKNLFVLTFSLASAYFLTGFASNLLLSIDGYAVASWPPSGIALAGLLLWNRRALPGIIIGALLTNIVNLDSASDIFNWQIAIQALLVTTASVLQAWIGAQFITKVIKAPLDLSSLKHCIQSLFIAGPVCCVLAAGVGTFLLVSNHVIPAHGAIDNFIAWWIGDSVGVLIFTPLVLAGFNYQQVQNRLQVIIPSLMIYIIISAGFYTASNFKKEKEIQKQELKILSVQDAISQRIDEVSAHLSLLATFFASSDEVTFDEFKLFTSKQLSYSQEIVAFEWVPYISAEQLADFERSENTQYIDDYYVKERWSEEVWEPVSSRDFYYPVLYAYPLIGNVSVIGFDLASNKGRAAALHKAKILNELVLSEPIDLVQNTQEKGVLFLHPVFGNSTTEDDFKGFVVAVVSLKKLSQSLLFDQNNLVAASFLDVTLPNQKQSIYTADTHSFELLKEYQLLIGKRIWQVQLHEPVVRTSWLMYWLAQIVGMLFVWLLITFLISVTGTNIQIREQVAKQTRVLRQEKQKADEASHIKSQFLANMSHEVRTPINGIKGLHYLALQQNDWPQARTYIEQADGALGVLLRVLNDVLDFSKMEAGKLDLVQEPINVGRLVDEVTNLMQFEVDVKSLELHLDYDKTTNLTIHTDPIRLKQILLNLLNNAVKFTAQGCITLKVWQSKKMTYFSVNDTGIGISEAAQKQLFKPFSQADSSTSRQYGGTGLGLSICKKLVELMGGAIDLASHEGKGSTFTFSVPLDSPLPKAEQVQQQYNEIDVESLSFTDYKLLLVEDNSLNQHVASAILKTKGCVADIASDGFEAIKMLTTNSYDIVLMDIQMPNMDGLQATKVIRNDLGLIDLPIIGLSANAHDDDVKKAVACGMDNYITKPIDANTLFKTLWHHLSHK
ncbi:CHASE domain-containing protein [Pseudoalteromonas fuliginea]|uniref:histidine kinase n=1 Tax=Pseudoalteromonas fuliginea TaxID=1872678 RepID=A0ABQ6RKL3_9GAMM|nr:CHASE domain-containing protein [Pseudoalteromonas fuliginea]KAA1160838.1 response regulator [Pseudoalteromonas fuliginea]KAA1168181.1 response regulator [Pseudoalteromonas fuliginea]